MTFDPSSVTPPGAKIKLIGVGGGGGNAVNTMIRSGLEGVDFIACNSDIQALRFSLAQYKIQIGKELTRGLGAGADPDIGRDAALEDRHEIQEMLAGADMVFITAGMGGGTGTGGASVVAQIARELGALTVAVVTKPFSFEGKRRRKHADAGISRLRENVDTLITIPNQRLLQVASPELSMLDAFKMADEVLVNAVRGISDIINIPGTVNVDFADVKTVMSCMGQALMGIGIGRGDRRAVDAARQAICSPLLEDVDIEGATGILINITAGANVTLMEVNEACSIVQEAAHEDANIIFGAVIDENLGEDIRVTVIATGFPTDGDETDAIEGFKSQGIPGIHGTRLASNPLAGPRPVQRPLVTTPIGIRKPENPRPVARPPEVRPAVSQPENTIQPPSVTKPGAQSVAPVAPENQAQVVSPQTAVAPAEPQVIPEIPVPYADPMDEVSGLAHWTLSALQTEVTTGDRTDLEIKETQTFVAPESRHEAPPVPQAAPAERITGASVQGPGSTDLDPFTPEAGGDFSFAEQIFDTRRETLAGSVFDFEDEFPETPVTSAGQAEQDKGASMALQPAKTPLESFFAGNAPVLADEIDRKIDEALELAEKLRSQKTRQNDEDDLDVPAFLRSGMKDLPLD